MKSKIYQVKVFENGEFHWKLDGKLHREDGPAVKYADGTEVYYVNGKLHREDGPAIKNFNGREEYYINDKCHREDGPAVKLANGYEAYYINEIFHREDGPAVKYADGTEEYWLNGNQYSKEAFYKKIHKRKNKVKKSLACENKHVIVDGVKYKLTKI